MCNGGWVGKVEGDFHCCFYHLCWGFALWILRCSCWLVVLVGCLRVRARHGWIGRWINISTFCELAFRFWPVVYAAALREVNMWLWVGRLYEVSVRGGRRNLPALTSEQSLSSL